MVISWKDLCYIVEVVVVIFKSGVMDDSIIDKKEKIVLK